MNEEIIEILEEMKEYASGGMTGLYFPEYMIQDLLDYITNLQQKVEQLEKENKELKQPQVYIDCENMEERYGRDLYEDYLKEKIEQLENIRKEAIEYIKDKMELTKECPQDLLNILNKGSE